MMIGLSRPLATNGCHCTSQLPCPVSLEPFYVIGALLFDWSQSCPACAMQGYEPRLLPLSEEGAVPHDDGIVEASRHKRLPLHVPAAVPCQSHARL